jgi:hypothetical protein
MFILSPLSTVSAQNHHPSGDGIFLVSCFPLIKLRESERSVAQFVLNVVTGGENLVIKVVVAFQFTTVERRNG